MRFMVLAAIGAALCLVGPADAKSRKIIDPIPTEIIANNHVVAIDVIAEGKAGEALAHFDAKAAEKAAKTVAGTAETSKYAHMPFREMFPLIFADVTKEWGLTGGRPIKLIVTLDTIKTANAGMAFLGSSADQLAGMVEVTDAEAGTKLGSFYIDVLNNHGGLLGMAMRGGGVREKLADEFALESSRILTGRKSKTPRT